MKKLSNIELFNGISGKVFADLYQSFPRETKIHPKTYLTDFIDEDDFDGAFDFDEMVKATIVWLDNAGYILLKKPENYQDGYSATLSHKGLETLKLIPDSITSTKSIGEKLIDFSKQKFGDGMNEIVKIAISEGIKLTLRQIT